MKITGLPQHKRTGKERSMIMIQRGQGSNCVRELAQKKGGGGAKRALGIQLSGKALLLYLVQTLALEKKKRRKRRERYR